MPSTQRQVGSAEQKPARASRPRFRPARPLAAELCAARRGDLRARARLVEAHLPLVHTVAARYRGLGLPVEDLVQEGSIGLLDSIDRYDPGRGVEFTRFAHWRIRRAMLNALTEQARLVRLPKHVVERRRAIAAARAELAAANGHESSLGELVSSSGWSRETIVQADSAPSAVDSLDRPVTPDGTPLADLVTDPAAPDPEQQTLEYEQSRLVDDAIDLLPPRERLVIKRHFGLEGIPESIRDLALDLHLSPQRTRALERDALHRLAGTLDPERKRV